MTEVPCAYCQETTARARIRTHASHHPGIIATHRCRANYVLDTQECMHRRNRNKPHPALHLIGRLNYIPRSNVPYKYLEHRRSSKVH